MIAPLIASDTRKRFKIYRESLGMPKFGPEPRFEPRTPKPKQSYPILRFGPVLGLVLSSGAGSVRLDSTDFDNGILENSGDRFAS